MSEPLRIKAAIHAELSPQLHGRLLTIDNVRVRAALLVQLAEAGLRAERGAPLEIGRLQGGLAVQEAVRGAAAQHEPADGSLPAHPISNVGESIPLVHSAESINETDDQFGRKIPPSNEMPAPTDPLLSDQSIEHINAGLGEFFA
jgi:hypothetical protein